MAKLTFTGRSEDGKRLLLVDESGQEHTLAVDARLRRAFAGAPDSNGQLEIPMESSLRPRDIQTRIRAGETPEAVAHAAGTSVEKIMPFAAPVMAERAHVAERAQLASVRRRATEPGARTLGEAVAAQLRAHNVDPGQRRVGRLAPRGRPLDPHRAVRRRGPHRHRHLLPRPARQLRDRRRRGRPLAGRRRHPGRAPDATPGAAAATPASDDLAAARQRRLTAVDEDVPLGDDAIEMVTAEESTVSPERDHDGALRHRTRCASSPWRPTSTRTGASRTAARTGTTARPIPSASRPPRPPAGAEAEAARKKRGRASVPSWDEIMFGGGKGD